MEGPDRCTRYFRQDDGSEQSSLTLGAPTPPLRALVRDYCLFEERRATLPERQHLPHSHATLIVSLEGHLDVHAPDGAALRVAPGQGFLAGLHTSPARTRSERVQRGLEIKLTPLGAHVLLAGQPMHALSNRSLSLEELLGRAGRELGDRLAESRDSGASFDVMDEFLLRRLVRDPARPFPDEVVFAWRQLERSHGRVRIGDLGTRLGWSRKRLVGEFRDRIGLAPKTVARVLRFDRAMERWKARPEVGWAELATECGYHDQAHFAREVRALSGQTATELADRLLPASGSVAAA